MRSTLLSAMERVSLSPDSKTSGINVEVSWVQKHIGLSPWEEECYVMLMREDEHSRGFGDVLWMRLEIPIMSRRFHDYKLCSVIVRVWFILRGLWRLYFQPQRGTSFSSKLYLRKGRGRLCVLTKVNT